MTHAQTTERVRQMVAEAFASLGVLKPEQFRESILMRAGHYCGRRFEAQGAHAVWFVEENQIKIASNDGRSRTILANSEPPVPTRRAA